MKRTTASLVTGALAAGTFAALATITPGLASATECGTSTINQDQLGDWFVPALSDTRATGHYAITKDDADGLRVWTDGTPAGAGSNKVAEYVAAGGILLADQTDPSNYAISYISNHGGPQGILPGYQLVVDFDGSGPLTPGILVGEPTANGYGENWWLSNGSPQAVKDNAPNTGGGFGSPWYGTLDEWVAEFPEATIGAFGFSLGSGVQNDVVIDSITFGCNVLDFEFKNSAPVADIVATDAGDNDYRTFVVDGSGSTDPDADDLSYAWTVTPGGSLGTPTGVTSTVKFPSGPGTHSVTLTVTDEAGLSTSTTKTFTVTPPPANSIGGDHLPNTGASVIGLAALTGLAVAGGAAGTVYSRRRSTSAV